MEWILGDGNGEKVVMGGLSNSEHVLICEP